MTKNLDFAETTRELLVDYEIFAWSAVLDGILVNTCVLPVELARDSRIARFQDNNLDGYTITEAMTVVLEHCDALEELGVSEALDERFLESWPCIDDLFSVEVNGSYVEIIRALMRNHSKMYNDALALVSVLFASIDNPGHEGRIRGENDPVVILERSQETDINQYFAEILSFVLLSIRKRRADQRFLDEFGNIFRAFHRKLSQHIQELKANHKPNNPEDRVEFKKNIQVTEGILSEVPALLEEYLVTAPLSLNSDHSTEEAL